MRRGDARRPRVARADDLGGQLERRDEAVRQISGDARQIKAIARTLGFSDTRGFRRAFQRWTGLTPQQFRERHRRRC